MVGMSGGQLLEEWNDRAARVYASGGGEAVARARVGGRSVTKSGPQTFYG